MNERRQNSIDTVLTNLGRLEGKIDGMHDTLDYLHAKVTQQNGRIGKLEQWRNGLIMVIGVFAFVVATFGQDFINSQVEDRWRKSDHELFAKAIQNELETLQRFHNE